MTLIECFDRSPMENIAGCLHLRPEKLILLGDETKIEPVLRRYRKFLKSRGMDTRVALQHICKNDPLGTAGILSDIVRREQDCVIDLSGGDEQVILAVGAMLAGLDGDLRRRVSVQKFDTAQRVLVDCDNDGHVVRGRRAALSVREVVALNGGASNSGTDQIPKDCDPRELDRLWAMVAADPKGWNRSIALLGEFESRSESKSRICLDMDKLRGQIRDFGEKAPQLRDLLEEFHNRGIIDLTGSRDYLRYTYTSPLMRCCTQKAGNVLEIKTLLEARGMEQNDKPYFDDCQMSVTIDWDGISHGPQERVPETKNEIDVLVTRGLVPLFISCKNGDIGDEELYKLHTVATRFGGPRARKMLIATNLDRKSAAANRSFVQRAWDMDIFVVTDAAALSREDWAETFRTAML